MSIEDFPYPICFSTVDILLIRERGIFLARKSTETQYRMVGGFQNPGEIRIESAAREFQEETGFSVNISDLIYFDEFVISDPRYKNSKHGITTTVFYFYFNSGNLIPSDDICEIKYFKFEEFGYNLEKLDEIIVPEHREILRNFIGKISWELN